VQASLDSNYFTWTESMAPMITGTPDTPELGDELTASFCRTDPDIARQLLVAMFSTPAGRRRRRCDRTLRRPVGA
jgi:sigma-B regulation protein RsbQ